MADNDHFVPGSHLISQQGLTVNTPHISELEPHTARGINWSVPGQKGKGGKPSPIAGTVGWSSCQEECSLPLAGIYQVLSLSSPPISFPSSLPFLLVVVVVGGGPLGFTDRPRTEPGSETGSGSRWQPLPAAGSPQSQAALPRAGSWAARGFSDLPPK